ncbi:RELT-like protein 2 [Chanos chanos]|uniref:RELT-like protein 2 n=1 Tax=Chanos chanos TaxID=29144 RepID=A0A6J2UR72_CHACN|nr:uncharacterized protein LOC115805388 [Chanos chanos]
MTDQEVTVGEPPPPYMIFILVFFFFITGLFGFLVCHTLKKRGYRCRTGEPEDDDDCEDKLDPENDDGSEENQDTVEQILKCIIENEANMEAFKEMLGNQSVCEHHDPRLLRKESLGGIPPHHHTVHSGIDQNTCHLCVQSRSKKGRRRSRVARGKTRAGEQTVFSVGRFRVTHMDKKNSLQGSTNLPVAESADQSEHTEPLNSEKENEENSQKPREGYDIRNMFKDVTPQATNGMAPNATKRKKSVTLLGFRRCSDPIGTKGNSQKVIFKEDEACETHDQLPEPPEESLATDATCPPKETEVAPDIKSPKTGSLNKLELVETLNFQTSPDNKQATKVFSRAGSPDSKLDIADVRIVKASPDSVREFAVVRAEEIADVTTTAPTDEGKDDMVEMEDIKDCRVSQEEDGLSLEEKRRSGHNKHKW